MLLQLPGIDMGVHLGGLYIAVAEKLLHAPQIGTAFEEMGGKAMTKGMHLCIESDCIAVSDESFVYGLSGQLPAPPSHKQRLGRTTHSYKVLPYVLQICINPAAGDLSDGDDADLMPLSYNPDAGPLVIGDFQVACLTDPQSAGVDELEQRSIAKSKSVGSVDAVKQGIHLGDARHLGKVLLLPSPLDHQHRVVFPDLAQLQKRKK